MEEPSQLQVSAHALEATQETANTKLPHTVSAQCAREAEVRVNVSVHCPTPTPHTRAAAAAAAARSADAERLPFCTPKFPFTLWRTSQWQ